MKQFLSKFQAIILSTVMLFSLSACGTAQQSSSASPSPSISSSPRPSIDPDEMARKAIENHKGNQAPYTLDCVEPNADSPLVGLNVCFLGSSVTYGEGAGGTSFVEIMARHNGFTYVKEAVSGTTLVDNGDTSYVQRMKNNIDVSAKFDLFICQLSTNDAANELPLGAVSEGSDLGSFDTSTVAGAIEYIIVYAKETWNCPVMFYTGSYYTSQAYSKMVPLLLEISEKWDIGVIDMWSNAAFNAISAEDRSLYMLDDVHPTMAGYLNWWAPYMEKAICDYMTVAG